MPSCGLAASDKSYRSREQRGSLRERLGGKGNRNLCASSFLIRTEVVEPAASNVTENTRVTRILANS